MAIDPHGGNAPRIGGEVGFSGSLLEGLDPHQPASAGLPPLPRLQPLSYPKSVHAVARSRLPPGKAALSAYPNQPRVRLLASRQPRSGWNSVSHGLPSESEATRGIPSPHPINSVGVEHEEACYC